jgi:hypothetical protein
MFKPRPLHNVRLIPWAIVIWRIVKRVSRLAVICNGFDTSGGVECRDVAHDFGEGGCEK